MLGLWGHLLMRPQRVWGMGGPQDSCSQQARVGRNSCEDSAGVKGKDKKNQPKKPTHFLQTLDLEDSSDSFRQEVTDCAENCVTYSFSRLMFPVLLHEGIVQHFI